jgi:hypothetical protein
LRPRSQLGRSFRSAHVLLHISNAQETLVMLVHYKSSHSSSAKTRYDSYYPSASVRISGFFFRLAAQTWHFRILNFVCHFLSQILIITFNISGNVDKFFSPEIIASCKYTTTMQSPAICSQNFPLKE